MCPLSRPAPFISTGPQPGVVPPCSEENGSSRVLGLLRLPRLPSCHQQLFQTYFIKDAQSDASKQGGSFLDFAGTFFESFLNAAVFAALANQGGWGRLRAVLSGVFFAYI